MRPSQTIALISIGLAMASCSAEPKSGSVGSLSGGVRFQHRVHERNDGKTMLIVTPVRGVVQDQTIISRKPGLTPRPLPTRLARGATPSLATVRPAAGRRSTPLSSSAPK